MTASMVGKRVRLTLEGLCMDGDKHSIVVKIPIAFGFTTLRLSPSEWPVEVIEPTLPTTPGSVIRARLLDSSNARLWVLRSDPVRWFSVHGDDPWPRSDLTDVTILFDSAGALDETP